MPDKRNVEEEFPRDVERLLAGERGKRGEGKDADYESVVAFAGRLVEYRIQPSPAFQEVLKKRLLSRLAEQEAQVERRDERTSVWQRIAGLVPGNPAWRAAAVTVAVAIVLAVVFWQTTPRTAKDTGQAGIMSTPAPSVAPAPAAPGLKAAAGPSVEVRESAANTPFGLGQPVVVQFSFTNVTPGVLGLPFPPPLNVVSAKGETVRSFPQGLDTRTLGSGESVTYTLAWDQRDDKGKSVPPGDYSVQLGSTRLQDGGGFRVVQPVTITITP